MKISNMYMYVQWYRVKADSFGGHVLSGTQNIRLNAVKMTYEKQNGRSETVQIKKIPTQPWLA